MTSFSEDEGFPGRLRDELREMAALRKRFTDCCTAIETSGSNADVVAEAIRTHLNTLTMADLPTAAQHIWQGRIARALKADASKPLSHASINAIRSWPSSRVNDVIAALLEIEASLSVAETDAHNEVIYAEISRAYS